jgi:phosphatidate phosphatase APP1
MWFSPAHGLSQVKSDESVLFFRTSGWLDAQAAEWVLPIHGWIYEAEEDSLLRAALIQGIIEASQLDPRSAESSHFQRRLRWFLVDNERGKRLAVTIAGTRYELEPSAPNGHFHGEVRLPVQQVARLGIEPGHWLAYSLLVDPSDERSFEGSVQLVPPEGVSVISDIDDTIKISEVADKQALVRNTFLEEFQAVPGMAALYARWAQKGAAFHYVSASPWQLYLELEAFRDREAFPSGSYHMKSIRLKDASVADLLASPLEYKPPVLRGILERYPGRRFVLVGDSGEKDPEVYGTLARDFPEQVWRIFIRRLEGEPADGPRYQQAFRDVPREKWALFDDPRELPDLEFP